MYFFKQSLFLKPTHNRRKYFCIIFNGSNSLCLAFNPSQVSFRQANIERSRDAQDWHNAVHNDTESTP